MAEPPAPVDGEEHLQQDRRHERRNREADECGRVGGDVPEATGAQRHEDAETDADEDADGNISLSELLRVIQFYNTGGYHCSAGSEDNFAAGPGDTACVPHCADYNPPDWQINLSELLRIIQFYNLNGYHVCNGGEDGYCPGATA